MEALLKEVGVAMVNELERANHKFLMFHSGHEAYAVIKEEKEEAEADMSAVCCTLSDYWVGVMKNITNKRNDLSALRDSALHGAAELIQAAAMAQKAIDSMEVNDG